MRVIISPRLFILPCFTVHTHTVHRWLGQIGSAEMLPETHKDNSALLGGSGLDRKSGSDVAKGSLSWPAIRDELKVLVMMAAPTIVQGAAQQGMLLTDQVSS